MECLSGLPLAVPDGTSCQPPRPVLSTWPETVNQWRRRGVGSLLPSRGLLEALLSAHWPVSGTACPIWPCEAEFVGHERSSWVSTCAGRFTWPPPAYGSGAFLRPWGARLVPVPGPAGSARMISRVMCVLPRFRPEPASFVCFQPVFVRSV